MLRDELERSAFDWLAALPGPVAPLARLAPRPHQRQAVDNAVAALAEPGRAQVRMACGTGKTLAALWVAERLDIERGLVLAPTLLLLKQLRAEWLREAEVPLAALAVCSSADVGEGGDVWELDPSDIPGEVTTDPVRIADFLRRPGRRVVFSTYLSSGRIAEAQTDPAVPAFDLAVADEAHKVAGVGSARDGRTAVQRTILDGTRIRADRRLFLTATPRIYAAGHRSRLEDEFGVEVASMDDEAVFGRVAHEFGFRAAVEAGILADYRLVVTVADDEAAAQAIHERQFVDVAGRPVDADQVATAIAVRRAVEELGLRRVISFHGTVARARTFAGLLGDVPLEGDPPAARWISGAQPVRDRELVLSELNAPDGAIVVSNARCLTEGIDVPALDDVAFADPRRSPIDLVQAIGRAMRMAGGKTTGWVIVPVHLGPAELADPVAAVESSAFEPVIAVLRALRSHDPLLATDAARIRVSLGPRPTDGNLADVPLDLVGPNTLPLERLLAAIRLRAVEVSADPWSSGLAALRSYLAREGHARVLVAHVEGEFPLGVWASTRRREHDRGRLRADRAAELEVLPGWTWDPHGDDWSAGLAALHVFAAREGEVRMSQGHVENGIRLGSWVNTKRIDRTRGRLRADRVAELEGVPGWTWDPRADDWSAGLAALRAFVAREGHARVAATHSEAGFRLGGWVHNQRVLYQHGGVPVARAVELEALPGWTWDPRADDWAAGLAVLRAFVAREGHARVPQRHREAGFPLGTWINQVRHRSQDASRTPDRIATLQALPGWTWDARRERFLRGVDALCAYTQREGHLRPPRGHLEQGVRLMTWASQRRTDYRRGKLTPEEITLLEAVPHWAWDPQEVEWADGLAALRTFVEREGHARVPKTHVEGTHRLGGWVIDRRVEHGRGELAGNRAVTLEGSPGWTWDPFKDAWEKGLAALRAYVAREGTARVPQRHREGEVLLGAWVDRRRQEHRWGTLAAERAALLEALPGWVWRRRG